MKVARFCLFCSCGVIHWGSGLCCHTQDMWLLLESGLTWCNLVTRCMVYTVTRSCNKPGQALDAHWRASPSSSGTWWFLQLQFKASSTSHTATPPTNICLTDGDNTNLDVIFTKITNFTAEESPRSAGNSCTLCLWKLHNNPTENVQQP